MLVLAISGSLRRGSYNTALLRAAASAAPAEATVELFDGLAALPPFSEDLEPFPEPPPVRDLRCRIAAADALLFATPEYNASVPGHLKTAVDWASRPYGAGALWDKPCAVIGASTGSFGAVAAQDELRKVLRSAGARVVDATLAVPRVAGRVDPVGDLASPELRSRLGVVLDALAEAADARRRLAA
jgi:chromate reductase